MRQLPTVSGLIALAIAAWAVPALAQDATKPATPAQAPAATPPAPLHRHQA